MKWMHVLGIALALGAVVLVLPDRTNPLPYGECHYKRPYLPDNWWVMEAPECLCGTMCRYEGWVPRLTIGGSLMEKDEKYDKCTSIEEKVGYISEKGPEFYLDLADEGCEKDFDDLLDKQGDLTAYYRFICQQHQGKRYIMIQYWFFYIFNDHVNDHEGEWEMIEVLLDYDTKNPIGAAYSRHGGGEYRYWNEIEKTDSHPVVYVAEGSHAAYFFQELFIFGNNVDKTSDSGRKGIPKVIPVSNQDWLGFEGNWGYRPRIPQDLDDCGFLWFPAPRGPRYQGEKWSNPVEWAFEYMHNAPEVLRGSYMAFSISCPADMLVTNSAGQRLGFLNGEFVQEIPDSYVHDLDEEQSYFVEGIDDYTVEIYGTGVGTFDLTISMNCWNNSRTLEYTNVPVTPTTKAVLDTASGFCLSVDTNQDGIIDFTVQPRSLILSSPQPIKPLQAGGSVTYEVVLTNLGHAASFALDIDAPQTWSCSLSSDSVFLNTDESVTVLLTAMIPSEAIPQDYSIRVKASSVEEDSLVAALEVVVTSKPELVVENFSATHEGEDCILTAVILNVGAVDAEDVKVRFFKNSSSDELLGEEAIWVPAGEVTTTYINCIIPDGLYRFLVVVDPENLIAESSEYNNDLSIVFLLDRTPPEARIYFDLDAAMIMVSAVDDLDKSVDILVIERAYGNKKFTTYTLIDDSRNSTELQIEINCHGQQIKAEIMSLKYNDEMVILPRNSFKVEFALGDDKIRMINQYLTIGDTEIHLVYNGAENKTRILMKGSQAVQDGLMLIVCHTHKGELAYELEKVREIS